MAERNQVIKHWQAREDLHYHLFLVLKSRDLTRKKKSTKIFVDMARFIGSKNSTQCRTHHEKKIQELKKQKHPAPEREYLRRYYYENYLIRRLGDEHLRMELLGFLEDLRDMPDGPVGGLELDELRDSIEAVLAEFAESLRAPEVRPEAEPSPLRPSEGETMETGPKVQNYRRVRNVRRVNVGVGVSDREEEMMVVDFESQEQEEELFWSEY